MILQGDCREVLATLDEASVDAIVTDPPYELGFMGKAWDSTGVAYDARTWAACLRVLKPGAYLLAFGGTRTYHRMACAIEDAGFEIRDQLQWLYAQGFPKSLNLRGDWEGWGTALKPANEPICLARRPLIGTVAENVQQYSTGALNINGCRIECSDKTPFPVGYGRGFGDTYAGDAYSRAQTRGEDANPNGRWPANVLLDEEAARLLNEQSGALTSGKVEAGTLRRARSSFSAQASRNELIGYGDSGGASRFFYVAKPGRSERGEENHHPTVKPVDLMRYLIRLVTPPGGVVLDPFAGSGTTCLAAQEEGFRWIACELHEEHVEIIRARTAQSTLWLQDGAA